MIKLKTMETNSNKWVKNILKKIKIECSKNLISYIVNNLIIFYFNEKNYKCKGIFRKKPDL